MKLSSKILQEAVDHISKLPGIGSRSALRIALHILASDEDYGKNLGTAISNIKEKIKICNSCYNISDNAECEICLDKRRDEFTLCVVEGIRDLIAIEETGQFHGRYHVLGGVISPINGIGPEQLNIDSLVSRVKHNKIKELIMAVPPTIDGDTTTFYLSRNLQECDVEITTISRGVAFGGALEYTDEVTLGRSILARRPYEI